MKKLFVVLLSVVAMATFVSCKDKPVPADNLPQTARSFLNTYFKGIDVISVIKESDGYDVRLIDGTEIDFRNNGEWKKVDCESRAVPAGLFLYPDFVYLCRPKSIFIK